MPQTHSVALGVTALMWHERELMPSKPQSTGGLTERLSLASGFRLFRLDILSGVI